MLALPPPSDEDVARVLHRTLQQARRDWGDLDAAWPEDDSEALQQSVAQEKVSLGDAPSPARRRRVAVEAGFSLHADTAVHGNDRQGHERLARYGRALRVRHEEGHHPHADGGGARPTPRRAAAAGAPPPDVLPRVYAPNAKLRPLVTTPPPSPPPPPQLAFHDFAPAPVKPKRPRLDWATLHRRTFGTDVLRCPCGGRRRVHAVHTTPNAAEERLAAPGRPEAWSAPLPAPASALPKRARWEQVDSLSRSPTGPTPLKQLALSRVVDAFDTTRRF